MKTILNTLHSIFTGILFSVTLTNDFGETIHQTIRARSQRAAIREAETFTDSDWYSCAVRRI